MRLKAFESGIDIQGGMISDSLDEALHSAVIISLLTDRRAEPDDIIPNGAHRSQPLPPDRRGWAGDALAEIEGDKIGSRLWLLSRAKQTEETRNRAIEYCDEALAWMLVDVATSIDVEAEWSNGGRLDVSVIIKLKDGNIFTTSLTVGVIYDL